MGIASFIITLLLLSFTIMQTRKEKHLAFSPITLFFSLWTIILLLSVLNLYNIILPSDEAYILILVMLLSFFIGYLLSKKRKKKQHNPHNKKTINEKSLYYSMIILTTVNIILNIIDLIIILQYLANDIPLWKIRNWTLEPFGSSNPILDRRGIIENLFRQLISPVLSMFIYPYSSYIVFNNHPKKTKIIILLFSIINLITSSFAGGGGRLGFIVFFGCMFFAYHIYYKKKKIRTKNRFRLYLILFLGVLALITTTVLRTGIQNIFKQIYTYFALSPTLLSLWLPSLMTTPHTFGLLTTYGAHSYIFRGLKMIGLGSIVPHSFDVAQQTMLNAEKFLPVGYGVANAFVSPVFYFFTDGGIVFVVIASLFFGYIVTRFYDSLTQTNYSIKEYIQYCFIMYAVFISFIRIQTVIPSFVIAFAISYFLPNDTQRTLNSESS